MTRESGATMRAMRADGEPSAEQRGALFGSSHAGRAAKAITVTTAITAITGFARARRDTLAPLGLALGVRLLVLLAADALLRWALSGRLGPAHYSGALESWQKKDAVWYVAIARTGYTYSTTGQSSVNFFPLYPALVASGAHVAFALANPYVVAGMAISWITFLVACVALYRLALRHFDHRVALGSVALLATFPFSFYYGAAYTESLYLALAVGAFLAVERQRWWVASALAMVAGAERPPGLILGLCVALAYLIDWLRTRHPLRVDILALALTPLGAVAYALYCWGRFGDPLAYAHASRVGWDGGHLQLTALRFIWAMLSDLPGWLTPLDFTHVVDLLYVVLTAGFLLALPLVWRRLGPVYAVFTAASVLAPLLDFPTVNSLGRYLSVAFPVFMVAAWLLREHPRALARIAIGCLLALIAFASCFIAGYGLS